MRVTANPGAEIECLACGRFTPAWTWRCEACDFEPPVVDGVRQLVAGADDESQPGYDEEFFEPVAASERGHWWFESRSRLIVWALARFATPLRRYLEVGCGTGFVLQKVGAAFPDAKVSGAEYFARAFAHVTDNVPNAELVRLDARRIPFKGAFDAVGAFDVLEHIADDRGVLAQLHDALRPGGTLVITVPQHRWLWTAYDALSHHERRYERRHLRERISEAGFNDVLITSFVSLLLPLMALDRLRGTFGNGEALEVRDVLRVHPLVNRVLETVMRLEFALIRRGVRFPSGGSLLVVARRPAH